MKLKDLIESQFELVELDGIGNQMLNAECETFEEVETGRDCKRVFRVRFEGYDNPLTFPTLRNPQNDGFFDFVFFDEDGWYFYEC